MEDNRDGKELSLLGTAETVFVGAKKKKGAVALMEMPDVPYLRSTHIAADHEHAYLMCEIRGIVRRSVEGARPAWTS